MPTLAELQRRRLDLADTLRAVLPVIRAYHDEQREQEVRALLARLAAGRFQLAVIGQFSRGKTTLMNALLGHAYLPTGALPMTSVVTTVRYGPRPRALVRGRATDLPLEVPVADVARYVTQAGTDRSRLQVAAVDVELPAELLRLGFEFVDTPGIGSAIAANTAATLRYLPQADAVVFVTGYDSAITAAEADLLARRAGQAGKLFVVVNKRDLVSDGVAAEVTSYVQGWARQHLGASDSQVFGLSALGALEGALDADSRRLADSGISQFRSALISFLTTGRGEASLRAVARAAEGVVKRLQRDLSAEPATSAAGMDCGAVLADFDLRMTDLQARLAAAAGAVTAKVESRLPAVLDGLRPLQPPTSSDAESGRETAAAWLDEQAGEVRDALIDTAASDIGPLLERSRSVRDEGAAIVGLPATEGISGWSGEDLPDLLISPVEWIVPQVRSAVRRPHRRPLTEERAAAILADSLAAAVTSFAERARAAIQEATSRWTRQLGNDAARHAAEEAVRFRRYLETPTREEDVALLADLVSRLGGYVEPVGTVASADNGDEADAGPDLEVAASSGHERPCAVCGVLEAALTQYLIHRQFVLATSESDQVLHAEAGGFCSLHTWQYAHLASAVGISAGNARLAEVVAGALLRLATEGGSAGDLAAAVERLEVSDACPACAEVAAAEHSETERLAKDEPADAAPVLCLRHLRLVLQAGPPPEVAAGMAGALGRALERAAQDMRSYALKREALRRALISADEADAYRHALRLLAGEPALAQPWEQDPDTATRL